MKKYVFLCSIILSFLMLSSTAYAAEKINLNEQYEQGNITVTSDFSWNDGSTEVEYAGKGAEYTPELFDGDNPLYTITYTDPSTGDSQRFQDLESFTYIYNYPTHANGSSHLKVTGYGEFTGTLEYNADGTDVFTPWTIIPAPIEVTLQDAVKIEGEDDPDEAAWTYEIDPETGRYTWDYDPIKDYQVTISGAYDGDERNIVWVVSRDDEDENPEAIGEHKIFLDTDEIQNDYRIVLTKPYAILTILSAYCKVIYNDGFGNNIFEEDVARNEPTPLYEGNALDSYKNLYEFQGWSPAIEELVTQDIVYTAQWIKKEQPEPIIPPEPEPIIPSDPIPVPSEPSPIPPEPEPILPSINLEESSEDVINSNDKNNSGEINQITNPIEEEQKCGEPSSSNTEVAAASKIVQTGDFSSIIIYNIIVLLVLICLLFLLSRDK